MRAYEIQGAFGLDHLAPATRPQPVCGPGRVRVRLAAASLNYRDLLVIKGLYNPRIPLPLVPGSDGVGHVVETGEGVTGFHVGDRVAACFFQGWIAGRYRPSMGRTALGGPLDGTLAEQLVLSEDGLVSVPDHLSDAEAATLACAGVTAWNALVTEGELRPGQTVLIQGTGGVSIYALQIARLMGARVIITSSSDHKLERAAALGAHHTINYRATSDWGKAAKQLTPGGEGVDLVIEVGGARTLPQSLRALRPGGRIALIGNLSGNECPINLTSVLMRAIRIQGVLVGSRADFEELNRFVALTEVRPVVDRTFSFERLPEALEYLASGSHFGKIAIAF